MLSASGLTRSIGTRILFRGVTLQLGPGRRVALIGGNGTGKTTMLEILVEIIHLRSFLLKNRGKHWILSSHKFWQKMHLNLIRIC